MTKTYNLRPITSCKLRYYALKVIPVEWRTQRALSNFVATKAIKL